MESAAQLVYGGAFPGPGSTAELTAISMLSPDEGWTVGCAHSTTEWHDSNGMLALDALFLHYTHGAWSRLRTPIRGRLTSVAMVSPNDGWAVGEEGLLAHYDGTTWEQIELPEPNALRHALQPAVRMLSATDGWAAGEGLGGTPKQALLRYDGTRWMPEEWPAHLEVEAEGIGPSLYLADLALRSSVEAWAVGTLCRARREDEPHRPSGGVILRFGGLRWAADTILDSAPLTSIAMLADGSGWAAGRRDSLQNLPGRPGPRVQPAALLLRHDGDAWVEVQHPLGPSSPQPASQFSGLCMRSADDIWLVATTLGRDETQPTLLHFDGRQWTPVALPWIQSVRSYGVSQLAMTSADAGWAVGISISKREDGRPAPQGGYTPTTLPVLLRYQQRAWSVVAS